MSKLTITEASKLVQISRTTMYNKYIKTGQMSVVKEFNKTYIDTCELFRLFPDVKHVEQSEQSNYSKIEQPNTQTNNHFEQLLQAKEDMISLLKEQLLDYKNEVNRLKGLEIKLIENSEIKKRKKFLGMF